MSDCIRVYVAGDKSVEHTAKWIRGHVIANAVANSDLVLFPGGTDIHPKLYDSPVGSFTKPNIDRDYREIAIYDIARSNRIPCVGVGRGAQLLCALAGGILVQHQNNEHVHPITTWEGRELIITSEHHQAAYPYNMSDCSYKLIAWTRGISKYHLDGKDREINKGSFKEAEIVYYPVINALGIQGHPEWMVSDSFDEDFVETLEYLNELVQKLLNKTL